MKPNSSIRCITLTRAHDARKVVLREGLVFDKIPSDILYLISLFLDLEDILKISETCKHLFRAIHEDKRLWISVVRSECIEIPYYTSNLENVSTETIYSWVKNAVSLRRAYATGGQHAEVLTLAVDHDLETTWVKIIRGHWYLAALSNTQKSFIGIWRTESSVTLIEESRYYFDGPILDCVIDDSLEEIHIAFTVAPVLPYIQVASLGSREGRPCLAPLHRLDGARHVLFLKADVICYKTMNGDDLHPCLTRLTTGETLFLYPMLCHGVAPSSLNDAHRNCLAATIWKGHIIAVFDHTLEIFPLPTFDVPHASSRLFGIQSLRFPMLDVRPPANIHAGIPTLDWVGEAVLSKFNVSPSRNSSAEESSLRISLRDRRLRDDRSHFAAALAQSVEDGTFYWEKGSYANTFVSCNVDSFCIGTTNEYQLQRSSTNEWEILLKILRLPRGESTKWEITPLFTPGLPILESITVMDFDDGAGLIFLGGCRGDLHVVRFLNPSSYVAYKLPAMRCRREPFTQRPVNVNLPACYFFEKELLNEDVPTIVKEDLIGSWGSAIDLANKNLPPGWSTDWAKNSFSYLLVSPFRRWFAISIDGTLRACCHSWSEQIRDQLGTCADIVPLMYKEEEESYVMLRLGSKRLFSLHLDGFDDPVFRPWPFGEEGLFNPAVLESWEDGRWRGAGRTFLEDRIQNEPFRDHLLQVGLYWWLAEFVESEAGRGELARKSLSKDFVNWSAKDRYHMRGHVRVFVRSRWR